MKKTSYVDNRRYLYLHAKDKQICHVEAFIDIKSFQISYVGVFIYIEISQISYVRVFIDIIFPRSLT